MKYNNGNAEIIIENDGSRVIEYEDTLLLDYPLNIDIRVSTQCSFGLNPITGKSFCSFCHESATTDGNECDYDELKNKLDNLPIGIELAIGSNNLTDNLKAFLHWSKNKGYINNLTINQGHLHRDINKLNFLIKNNIISGLGISYRSELKWSITESILNYTNTVFHVIAGIDSIDEVIALRNRGVKKVLVLGEKDFGFNKGNVNLTTRKHKEWVWWVHKLFSIFDVVSFDNLALEQLRIKRFFTDEKWEVFNQRENSFYLNAVDKYFAPSSRSNEKKSWHGITVKDYFNNLQMSKYS